MKRILSLILGIMCGITFGFACICVPKTKTEASISSGIFDESLLVDKQDIIGVNASFSSMTAKLNATPFDKETKAMMPGFAYAPNTSTDGQINTKIDFSSTTSEFVAQVGQSVYVWLYFPANLYYELKLGFYNSSGNGVYWYFDTAELSNLLSDNGTKTYGYGWRLFELNFKDAALKNVDSAYTSSYSVFEIVYKKSDLIDSASEVTESLSFYHVYKASSFGNTGVCKYQNYAVFELKQDFLNSLENIFVGDALKYNGIYDVFEYVIVGNKDLKNYSDIANFSWLFVISDANSEKITIKYGEEYTFKNSGWYSINVKLYKTVGQGEQQSAKVLLNTSTSFFIDEFGMGSFSGNNYFFEKGSKHLIKFTFTEGFVIDDEIVVTAGNKRIANATYYIEGNNCYVVLDLLKVGTTKITISAKGHREGYTKVETYSKTLDIHVKKGEDKASKVLLWVSFGIFCATGATYLVISFVKARRFGVK